jgi:predicted restriction endonuclease
MKFNKWLGQIGKSKRTANSYSNAISGSITDWAKNSGLVTYNLTEITDISQFRKIAEEIKKLPAFQNRDTKGNGMYSAALNQYSAYLADLSNEEIQEDITELLNDPTIDETEKATLVNARVGQGRFRQLLIDQWHGCALTGYGNTRLLVASHIKPWRKSNNQERIDPFNGLLLLPNLDKVFDLGYITFTLNGGIIISKELEEASILGVKPDMAINLDDGHRVYMEYHRDLVFEKRI